MANQTSFNSETARAAGIRSGASRALKKPDTLVSVVLEDLLYARAALVSCLKAQHCKTCDRSGPANLRDLTDLIKQLSDLSEQILNRYRGRPSVESNLERHASPSEYAKAVKQLDDDSAEIELDADGIPVDLTDSP